MQDNTKSYVMTTKQDESYILPVKSVIAKHGLNTMQLIVTQGTSEEEIPIFKSKTFSFYIDESINADSEAPEEYPQWIDTANTKLNEIDDVISDIETKLEEGYFKGEKGDTGEQGPKGETGEQGPKGDTGATGERGEKGETGSQGIQGEPGRDGYVQYTAGGNITIENNVISANGIPTKTSDLENDSNFTSQEVFYINNNSSTNPFVFDGKKKGIYYINKAYHTNIPTTRFYYKLNENITLYYHDYAIEYIILNNDFNYDNLEKNVDLGIVKYTNISDGNSYYGNIYVNDTLKIAIRNEYYIGKKITDINQTIVGVKTFLSIPKQNNTTAPTQNTEFTNKKYVDDSIASAITTTLNSSF